jgi:endonuclease G
MSRRKPGPDLSFFEVEVTGAWQAGIADRACSKSGNNRERCDDRLSAYDSRIPEPDLMEKIFGKTYNKKRLAPGGVTNIDPKHIWTQLHHARGQFRFGRD